MATAMRLGWENERPSQFTMPPAMNQGRLSAMERRPNPTMLSSMPATIQTSVGSIQIASEEQAAGNCDGAVYYEVEPDVLDAEAQCVSGTNATAAVVVIVPLAQQDEGREQYAPIDERIEAESRSRRLKRPVQTTPPCASAASRASPARSQPRTDRAIRNSGP